jgi:exodeoxyribonuclease VIII
MPGRIIRDMPCDQYVRTKAMSASGAYVLAKKCPSVFWHRSPWNPAFEPEPSKEGDFGSAVHLALLQPELFERQVVIGNTDDWRTKAARELRDLARSEDKIPLLPKDLEAVEAIAAKARRNPWIADLLDGAQTEISYFWDAAGIPCKARCDLLSRDGSVMADIKTSHTADPYEVGLTIDALGWFLRDPFYRDGWKVVTGNTIQRYFYIVIDREPPNPITIGDISERGIEWGRLLIRRALRLFDRCMRDNDWPDFARDPITFELSSRTEWRLAAEEESGRLSSDDVVRSMRFLQPQL